MAEKTLGLVESTPLQEVNKGSDFLAKVVIIVDPFRGLNLHSFDDDNSGTGHFYNLFEESTLIFGLDGGGQLTYIGDDDVFLEYENNPILEEFKSVAHFMLSQYPNSFRLLNKEKVDIIYKPHRVVEDKAIKECWFHLIGDVILGNDDLSTRVKQTISNFDNVIIDIAYSTKPEDISLLGKYYPTKS